MTPREFAIEVVEKLQAASFEALWAGGCVRDQLLNLQPKDYDVATNAVPEQIRQLFGKKRTLSIGAAFGVITVLGPRNGGQVEVATFRRDASYSDGRHPDAVQFTDAREDALRRDFTINGMFYDPIKEQVIDYVGGRDDLATRTIRAIGDPHERIDEDKLRMLRGVRFASTFGFNLEPETLAAIQRHAPEIRMVSEERIGVELIRMLAHGNNKLAAQLLMDSHLLAEVLPPAWLQFHPWDESEWGPRLEELGRLASTEFAAVASVLLRSFLEDERGKVLVEASSSKRGLSLASSLQSAWRLTNDQRDRINWISANWQKLASANKQRWSEIQPLLIHAGAQSALDVATAIVGSTEGIQFCQQRLRWPADKLDPPSLIDGRGLIELGIHPGPKFKDLLVAIRTAQLDGQIETAEQAAQFARENG